MLYVLITLVNFMEKFAKEGCAFCLISALSSHVEVLQEVIALFKTFDKDNSGSICFNEFLGSVRVNKSCVITVSHFISYCTCTNSLMDHWIHRPRSNTVFWNRPMELVQAFRSDLQKERVVQVQWLDHIVVAVMCLCLMFMYQEVGDLFNTIDMDRSGTIDFDEFLRHLRVTKTLNAKIGIIGLQHLVLDFLLNFRF